MTPAELVAVLGFVATLAQPRPTLTPEITKPVWTSNPLPDPTRVHDLCAKSVYKGAPLVEARLLSSGTVAEVRVTRSCGCRAADKLLEDTVKTWKFKPASQAGKPIATWFTMVINHYWW